MVRSPFSPVVLFVAALSLVSGGISEAFGDTPTTRPAPKPSATTQAAPAVTEATLRAQVAALQKQVEQLKAENAQLRKQLAGGATKPAPTADTTNEPKTVYGIPIDKWRKMSPAECDKVIAQSRAEDLKTAQAEKETLKSKLVGMTVEEMKAAMRSDPAPSIVRVVGDSTCYKAYSAGADSDTGFATEYRIWVTNGKVTSFSSIGG